MSIHVVSNHAPNLAELEVMRLLTDEIERAKKEGVLTVNIPDVGQIVVTFENPAFLPLLNGYNKVATGLINKLRENANLPTKTAKPVKIDKARIKRNFYPLPEDIEVY